MISKLIKSLNSIGEAGLGRYVMGSVLFGVGIIALMVIGISYWADQWIEIEKTTIDNVVTVLIGAATGVAGWFMLPAFSALFVGLFVENIIHRVELRYYPEEMRERAPGFWPDFWHDIRFTIKALLLNILVLPLYAFGIGFFISVVLNSYLIGREFFEAAAGYHLGKDRARDLIGSYPVEVYGGGFILTLLTLIPLVNFFVPLLSVVYMVHTYHRLK